MELHTEQRSTGQGCINKVIGDSDKVLMVSDSKYSLQLETKINLRMLSLRFTGRHNYWNTFLTSKQHLKQPIHQSIDHVDHVDHVDHADAERNYPSSCCKHDLAVPTPACTRHHSVESDNIQSSEDADTTSTHAESLRP